MSASRQFAAVTGASTWIGLGPAKSCAQNFDLPIAADDPRIETAAAESPEPSISFIWSATTRRRNTGQQAEPGSAKR